MEITRNAKLMQAQGLKSRENLGVLKTSSCNQNKNARFNCYEMTL